jgi:hypothetical protein
MIYYNKEEFMKIAQVSRSTIDRFYREHPKLGEERIKEGKRKNIPQSHLKYFSWELLFEEEKTKDKHIFNLQKIIALAREASDSLPRMLWEKNWVWYGTLTNRRDLSKDIRYQKMQRLYEELSHKFGQEAELKFFFTTDVRDGNNSHFVVDCAKDYVSVINKEIKQITFRDRVDLRFFDPYQCGLFIIAKYGLKGSDWNYLF